MTVSDTHSDAIAASGEPSGDEWVVPFDAIGADDLPTVGGKGANLGEMTRAGMPVPGGFCVTTHAFRAFVRADPVFAGHLEAIAALEADDLEGVRVAGAAVRAHLEGKPMPSAIGEAVIEAWRGVGEGFGFAVRSSATAEDLPTASFAGQQDTYLNVRGRDALLDRVRACWASLFTDRAILYRRRNGIEHAQVSLSVVVQRMVHPQKSGILFTADPLSGHRGQTSIDAGFGLGEALVSGLINADLYRVETATGRIIEATVGDKALAIESLPDGGTREVALAPERRTARVLSDAEVAELVGLGRRIEAHYGRPQDIEWCIDDGALFVVQARPITSLYPLVSPAPSDASPRVFACFNHFQVMTDAMPPLAIDVWRYLAPFGRGPADAAPSPETFAAGGRMFIDFAKVLRRAPLRKVILSILNHVDANIASVMADLVARPGFDDGPRVRLRTALRLGHTKIRNALANVLWRDPAKTRAAIEAFIDRITAEQIARIDAATPGPARMKACTETLAVFANPLFDQVPPAILASAVGRRMLARLAGEADPEDMRAIERGLIGNVTTDMDLEVGDLADLARAAPAVAEALTAGEVDISTLRALPGGSAFVDGFDGFIARYGCRGPSEIDISRPRWREAPGSILKAVAGNVAHAEQGVHRAHHAALGVDGQAAGARLVSAAGRGLLGPLRRWWAGRMLRLQQNLAALREHPKFAMVQVIDRVRKAALEAGALLVEQGRLAALDDVWMFTFAELCAPSGDLRGLAAERRADFEHHRGLSPPGVMTEAGEIPIPRRAGAEDAPPGALVGSPVSSGVIEGIVRVVRDPHTETLHKGEILVAPFTDPGWTPLFINAAGLVMEVGGRMTHGSVVAREYGLPAVVAVPGATEALRTGMRVRVDGDRGFIEILDAGGAS